MSKGKKLFVVFAVIFAILLGYASYDIARRTTFPGSKPQLQERLKKTYLPVDSMKMDSLAR
jgi:cytochrome b